MPDLGVSASPTVIFEGEQVNLLAQSTQTGIYLWNNSSVLSAANIPNPIATPTDTTEFVVQFRDENGCINTDTVKIFVKEVICGDPYIFVPNAFTPNFDGNNDYFKPYYPLTLVTEVFFAVYDRWECQCTKLPISMHRDGMEHTMARSLLVMFMSIS